MNSHERIRVLLADDHRILREALGMMLASERDIVGEAVSGEASVAMATQLRPHVVVLDVGCLGWAGLRRRIGSSCDAPACKVLSLRQYDDEEYVIEALGEASPDGYLVKTAAASELLAAVRALHSGRRGLSPSIALSCSAGCAIPDVSTRAVAYVDAPRARGA